jgi:hypothetical protein
MKAQNKFLYKKVHHKSFCPSIYGKNIKFDVVFGKQKKSKHIDIVFMVAPMKNKKDK